MNFVKTLTLKAVRYVTFRLFGLHLQEEYTVSVNESRVIIPIIQGVGFGNLLIESKEQWMGQLFQMFKISPRLSL